MWKMTSDCLNPVAGDPQLHVFTLSGAPLFSRELAGGVRCVLLSADGALLIAGGVRGDLAIWQLDDGDLISRLDGVGAAVSCACVTMTLCGAPGTSASCAPGIAARSASCSALKKHCSSLPHTTKVGTAMLPRLSTCPAPRSMPRKLSRSAVIEHLRVSSMSCSPIAAVNFGQCACIHSMYCHS